MTQVSPTKALLLILLMAVVAAAGPAVALNTAKAENAEGDIITHRIQVIKIDNPPV